MEEQIQRILIRLNELDPTSDDYYTGVLSLDKMVDIYGKMLYIHKMAESDFEEEDEGEEVTFVIEGRV